MRLILVETEYHLIKELTMKTISKTKAQAIINVMSNQHNEILNNRSTNTATYSRMKLLLNVLRSVCFDIARTEPVTAEAYFECADKMISEAYSKVLRNIADKEFDAIPSNEPLFRTSELDDEEEVIIDGLLIEPYYIFDCNDEDCDPYHNYKEKFLAEPLYRGNDE